MNRLRFLKEGIAESMLGGIQLIDSAHSFVPPMRRPSPLPGPGAKDFFYFQPIGGERLQKIIH
jgi:hypothetical protein